jgi:PIN domain nuclease of toxin-antitoxin system
VKLLLDTHVLAWAMLEPGKLSAPAKAALDDDANTVLVSVASAWEIAIKVGLGKWPEATPFLSKFENEVEEAGLEILPISVAHVRCAGLMQSPHRDPFDRLLAAQAIIEGLTVVTVDEVVAQLGVRVLW